MKRALLMAGLLLLPVVALADGPETGVVSGKVTDASGTPLPGAAVTLRGTTGETVLHTDTEGAYRFALIRPGSYSVKAELEGFLPQEASANVTAGGRADVDFELSLGTSEEITVTSEAPMVDKFNVTVGGSVKADTVQEVAAVNRGIYGAIALLPGVTNDEESADLSSSRPSFNGTPWQESAVFIDGVDTTFTRYGATRMFVPNSATTEISMQASASGADYGRAVGGITNVIVKSGTNRFHGDVTGIYQNLKWDGNFDPHQEFEEHPTRPRPADFFSLTPEERDADSLDYELGLGGPIKRDKAWFFVALGEYGTFTRDRTLNGDLIDQSTNTESYIAKLNVQPSTDHSVAVSWMSSPITRLFQLDNFADPYVPTFHDIGGSLATANWNWSMSQSLFLETKIAHQVSNEDKLINPCHCTDLEEALALKQQDPRFAPTPELAGMPRAPVNNYDVYIDNDEGTWHNGWLLDNGFGINRYPRDQANVGLTQFLGQNHELKFGVDWQQTEWEQDVAHNNLYTGRGFDPHLPLGYATLGTATPVFQDFNPADMVAEGKGSGTAIGENTGLYVRDRFTVGDHWTFNLGLRLEDQVHENDIGRTVIDSTDLSPRMNTVYDVKGDGRMLFSLSAGRYHSHLTMELINSNLLDGWNGFNAVDTYLYCDPIGFLINLANCRSAGIGNFGLFSSSRPGAMWDLVDAGVLDIEIEPYGRDEVVLGWEWQFSDSWASKVRAIAWESFDQIGAGLSQLGPLGTTIEFTENISDLPQVLRDYGWIDEFVSQGYGTPDQAEAALASFDDAHREYRALQIELNRRFNNNWAWYNNITFAEAEGNVGGTAFNNTAGDYGSELHVLVTEADIADCELRNLEDRPADAQADCQGLRPFLGLPITTVNRFGDLERERPVVFKSYGQKLFELGNHTIALGGQFTYQDGVRWGTRQPSVESFDGADTATLWVEPRGSRQIGGHSWINVSGAWGFPLPRAWRGELRLEITNVTDRQDLTGVSASTGRPQQSKRSWTQPRKVRLVTTFRF